MATGICWRDHKTECPKSMCCYDASSKAVFEYWKFADSQKWKKMLQAELEKERKIQC